MYNKIIYMVFLIYSCLNNYTYTNICTLYLLITLIETLRMIILIIKIEYIALLRHNSAQKINTLHSYLEI
jgi:hypothetical protein